MDQPLWFYRWGNWDRGFLLVVTYWSCWDWHLNPEPKVDPQPLWFPSTSSQDFFLAHCIHLTSHRPIWPINKRKARIQQKTLSPFEVQWTIPVLHEFLTSAQTFKVKTSLSLLLCNYVVCLPRRILNKMKIEGKVFVFPSSWFILELSNMCGIYTWKLKMKYL